LYTLNYPLPPGENPIADDDDDDDDDDNDDDYDYYYYYYYYYSVGNRRPHTEDAQQCSWAPLCGLGWHMVTDVSGQPIGLILRGQAVAMNCQTDRMSPKVSN
jgi:hypothetical protein